MRRLSQVRHNAIFFLFLFTVCKATEKEILLKFKSNVLEDPFGTLTSWDPNRDTCGDYTGVSCNSDGFVQKIILWNTSLSGVLSPAISGLKCLGVISLFGNRFTGNVPNEFSVMNSLWKINFSSNALSGSIPDFLGDLRNIRFLDLSWNDYTGSIPKNLFKFCDKAKFISLSHNNLSGSIPVSIKNCSNLSGFDFSFNSLNGGLPSEICSIPRLSYLSVRSNALTGNVEEELSGCHSLELLDLSSNIFCGPVPFRILGFENITHFNVSRNQFRGNIPQINMCSGELEILDASVNGLDGKIPKSIVNCNGLKLLDLQMNKLRGNIPKEIVNLENLVILSLGDNLINGTIPDGFGSIELLQVLDLQNMNLIGEIPNDISNCRFLLELDISGNALCAEIPQTLGNLTHLKILNLHHNQFNGTIPFSIGTFPELQILDFSHNSLSGSIPSSLSNLTHLTYFNISYNLLCGHIPSLHFGPSSFSHNANLCGSPLTDCSPDATVASPSQKQNVLSTSAIVAIVASSLILFGVCLISFMNSFARRKGRHVQNATLVVETIPSGSLESSVVIGKLVLFSRILPSKYEDWESGAKALLDNERVVGVGSIGAVYKADFDGGISIAVKRLEILGRMRNQDDFEQEIGRLGSLRHANLIAIQGYYWSAKIQLILSNFAPNGNLYDNLHGPITDLTWPMRFRIGLGTARALAYLHCDCKPAILHLNIKSTNILLDEKFCARLSDYGLQKFLPILENDDLTKSHAAVGYVAPELAHGSRVSEKCDVYGFGVILLELVTGQKPVEMIENEIIVLCEHVKLLLKTGIASDCFDSRLPVGFTENELVQVMKLGLICTCEVALRRPNMSEVVQVLETIGHIHDPSF